MKRCMFTVLSLFILNGHPYQVASPESAPLHTIVLKIASTKPIILYNPPLIHKAPEVHLFLPRFSFSAKARQANMNY